MGNIANGELNTFVDGQIVSANDATYGLNPKMEVIRAAVNDNDSRISVLEGQIATTNANVYNVKSAPYSAVGDGITNDTASIQAAISAAVANKGIVVFPFGTYLVSDYLAITGACTIMTQGSTGTATITQATVSKGIFSIQSSNVQIYDLTLTITNTSSVSVGVIASSGSSSGSYYSNIRIERCTFNHQAINGIQLSYCSKSSIRFCTFSTTNVAARYAMNLAPVSTFDISNNYITTSTSGLVISNASTFPSNDVVVYKNSVSSKTDAIEIFGSTNIFIVENVFTAQSGASSSYTVQGGTSSGIALSNFYFINNVIDNVLSPTGMAGLDLDVSTAFFIGNLIKDVNGNYLQGTNIQIQNNRFENSNLYGIRLSGAFSNVSISNNSFTDVYYLSSTGANASAIYLNPTSGGGTYTSVTNNTGSVGSKVATAKNVTGVYLGTAQGTVSYSGNDFVSFTNQISGAVSLNYLFHYVDVTGKEVYVTTSTSAPTIGTWTTGQKVIVQTPVAGGYIGYVCTAGGTPGTWKGFGAIQV